MVAIRNVFVWTLKSDIIVVDRGFIFYDLFDKNVVKMYFLNIMYWIFELLEWFLLRFFGKFKIFN